MSKETMKLALEAIQTEPVLTDHKGRPLKFWGGKAEQSAQQEPVAVADGTFNHNCPVGTPLYTSPPAQRPWVGLTDADVNVLTRGLVKSWVMEQIARTIEAKLKEKNT